VFSIIKNTNESLAFFDQFNQGVSDSKPIIFDVSNVEEITIDTLLYFLASKERLKKNGIDFFMKGNFPKDQSAAKKFINSGFLEYMSHVKNSVKKKSEDCVQIHAGSKSNPEIAKKLCVFCIEKLGISRNDTKGLYDIIMEIIINTTQHAYRKRDNLSKWYAYAWFDSNNKEVHFSLLDTGIGIPSTIRKNILEKSGIKKLFSNATEQDKFFLSSALKGEFRSETKEEYRGKGLPRIAHYRDSQYIDSLAIVSNYGYIGLEQEEVIFDTKFQGTLFSWRMKANENQSI
jgi:hypothetical protein